MTKYVMRAQGRSTPLTFTSEEGPQGAFDNAIKRSRVEANDVYSFWQVGKAFRQDSRLGNGQTVSMWDREPGAELIFLVRGLPELPNDARSILGGNFASPRSRMTLQNQERVLTERARSAFDELISAGLLYERELDDGYPEARTYGLTDAGKVYPRFITFEFAKRNGNFPLLELSTREFGPEKALDEAMEL